MSLFLHANHCLTTDLIASQVLLDRFIPWLGNAVGYGSSFSVDIVETEILRHGIYVGIPAPLFEGRDKVALKTLLLSGESYSPENQARWKGLAVEYQVLTHPFLALHSNIVSLLGISWRSTESEPGGISPVLILEAADCGSLSTLSVNTLARLELRDRLPIVLRIWNDVGEGISALHQCGIIHGDLKPDNVLIFANPEESGYRAKLADFGSAITLPDFRSRIRSSGGTPDWQAPECVRPLGRSGLIRTEIYSFGLILFNTLLPGVLPHSEPLTRQITASALVSTYFQLEILTTIIHDCLDPNPDRRPGSIAFVLERLQGLRYDLHTHPFLQTQLPTAPVTNLQLISSGEDVPSIVNYLATFNLFPKVVTHNVLDSLKQIANCQTFNWGRRSAAAFQLSFALICGLDNRNHNHDILASEMLHLAAEHNYPGTRVILGQLSEALGSTLRISDEKEQQWLLDATLQGSAVARRRLLKLDHQRHYDVVHGSCHVAQPSIYTRLENTGSDQPGSEYLLHRLAIAGRPGCIKDIVNSHCLNINEKGLLGETPLLLACRNGHLSTVQALLDLGADAKLSDDYGTTPLHWLSRFHESEVDIVVKALIQHGADIEARSKGTRAFKKDGDHFDFCGCYGGTPLLWAVVDYDLFLAKILMDAGADPWDDAGNDLPVSNEWSNSIHWSPVLFAVRGRMHEILQLFLERMPDPSRINTHERVMGSDEYAQIVSLLGFSVIHSGFGLFETMIFHGADYRMSWEATIRLLLDHGANPRAVTHQGHTLLELAAQNGEPFMFNTLSQLLAEQYPVGRPEICHSLFYAVCRENEAVFDALLSENFTDMPWGSEGDRLLLQCARRSDNPHFVDQLLNSGVEVAQPQSNTIFEVALTQGNFQVARTLYNRGFFNPLCLERYNFAGECAEVGQMTVLGKIILNAARSSGSISAVEFLLNLIEDEHDEATEPHPAFWAGNDAHGYTSVLHLAAMLHPLRDDLTRGSEVLDAVLNKFHRGHHLNSKGFFNGFTPLHVAVYSGNINAIRVLLEEDGIDRQALDDSGRTPMDLALYRLTEPDDPDIISTLQNQASPSDNVEFADRLLRQNCIETLVVLIREGLPSRRYDGAVLKDDETAVACVVPNYDGGKIIQLNLPQGILKKRGMIRSWGPLLLWNLVA
ncbi:hypothetical protein ABOM_008652 [Aspergillus bombycis]|uniref:Protein kinase domain-containing protein n=1 Tax=Aspergillus bombycis TaxID=109264 RepID=A0A1F7ZV41_9EURO|nr:hypothetical protein ABOM_008652 [Aspergillus bombycis]OGM43277.1 hypothetical protein ABOM_008652 [Aspergillus bombycis]